MQTESKSKLSLIMFSGDFDKAMAALTIANGGAGDGLDVAIFFTFWGLNILRKKNLRSERLLENLFKSLMPLGPEQIGLSKMNFCGIGPFLLKKLIRQKNGQTVSDLLKLAMERNIHFIACEASLKMLGIAKNELIDYENLEVAGVDKFISLARQSEISLFI